MGPPENLIMNASELPEYAFALSALEPVLYDLPPKIIAIDGKSGIGKTTLGRFLAWRFNISLLESDLFLIRNRHSRLKYRMDDIGNIINSRIRGGCPIILDGIVALRLLRDLQKKHDFHIHVVGEQANGDSNFEAQWKAYESEFMPQNSADLVLKLTLPDPFSR